MTDGAALRTVRARPLCATFRRHQPRPMHLDAFRQYCLAKPGATKDLPFGPDALVFKVAGKMFALASLGALPPEVNLKCDPERAVELRERYAEVRPGYHMNKRHWNTIGLQGDVPGGVVRQLVDHSYDLVVAGLTRRVREELAAAVDRSSGPDGAV